MKGTKPNQRSAAGTLAQAPHDRPVGPAYPPFVRVAEGGGVHLAIKLQPRASRNQIDGPVGEELHVRVTAPPVDSAANEALLSLLAEALDCPRGAVQLVRGQTSRHKTVCVRGLEVAKVVGLLSKPVV